jgi:hypothetical protein
MGLLAAFQQVQVQFQELCDLGSYFFGMTEHQVTAIWYGNQAGIWDALSQRAGILIHPLSMVYNWKTPQLRRFPAKTAWLPAKIQPGVRPGAEYSLSCPLFEPKSR